MNIKTKLADLEPRDIVLVDRSGFHRNPPSIALVDRVTKTQVIVEGRKFNKRTGREVGLNYYFIYVPDSETHVQEIRNEHEKLRLVLFLSNLNWKDQSLDVLRSVKSAIRAASPTILSATP